MWKAIRCGATADPPSLTVYLKDDRSLSTDEFITLMREQTSGIDNASVEVEEQSSMSFGSRGVQVNLSGSNLDTLRDVADEIKAVVAAMDGIDSASTSLSNGSPRAEIIVDPVQAAAIGTTPSAILSTAKNMISGHRRRGAPDERPGVFDTVMYPEDRFKDVSDLSWPHDLHPLGRTGAHHRRGRGGLQQRPLPDPA